MKKLFFILLLFPFLVKAHVGNPPATQNAVPDNSKLLFPNYTFQPAAMDQLVIKAQAYLVESLPELKANNVSLKLVAEKESPVGYHFSFKQMFAGKEIFGTETKINIGKNFKVLSLLTNLVSTAGFDAMASFPNASDPKSLVGAYPKVSARQLWYYVNGKGIPSLYIDYSSGDGLNHSAIILDADNTVLYQKDLRMGHQPGKDSTVTAYVFVPDPLTSARHPYEFPYVDDNDSGIPALDAQRFQKPLTVSYDSTGFYLSDSFLTIDDQLSPPYLNNFVADTNVFNFSRGDHHFEDVNAFFNIHEYNKHLRALGFSKLGKRDLTVDPHALDGEDNSYFDTNADSSTMILFGTGGIYDAQDADVIWHEYTHFISYDANLNNGANMDDERLAVEEGSCDYIAASYSKYLSDYNWEKVYNWDGNTSSWHGRSCASTKVYPTDYQGGNKYNNCEIWSAALMESWDVIGRDKMDKLLYTSLYNFGNNSKMRDCAVIMLQMDSLLYGGVHVNTLASRFHWHGLLPDAYLNLAGLQEQTKPAGCQVLTQYFSPYNKVLVNFDSTQYGTLSLYDLQGRLISNMALNGESNITFQAPALSNGVYILHVNTGDIQQSVKLVK
jgi:hypothetical protein